jgi:vancomycin permeability regulator SanA
LQKVALLLVLCFGLLAAGVLIVSLAMVDVTTESITTIDALAKDADLSEYDCVLVLGAGVRPDGTPSAMLYDRVTVACDLYETTQGKIPLLMSGDHTGDYNEVGVMKNLATEWGVPSERVFLDHEGDSTFESLWRARTVFGAKKLVIVTQQYHLHRALYIARELGMEAVGVSADLRPYRKQAQYSAREQLARFKDMFAAAQASVAVAFPPTVDLNGDGNATN